MTIQLKDGSILRGVVKVTFENEDIIAQITTYQGFTDFEKIAINQISVIIL